MSATPTSSSTTFLFFSSACASAFALPPVPSWPSCDGSTGPEPAPGCGSTAGAAAAGATGGGGRGRRRRLRGGVLGGLGTALGRLDPDRAVGQLAAGRRSRPQLAAAGSLAGLGVRRRVRRRELGRGGRLLGRRRGLGRGRRLAGGVLLAARAGRLRRGRWRRSGGGGAVAARSRRRGGGSLLRLGGRRGAPLRRAGHRPAARQRRQVHPAQHVAERARQVLDVRHDVLGELVHAHALHGRGHHHAREARARLAHVQRVHRLARAELHLLGQAVEPGLPARERGIAAEPVAERRVGEQPLDELSGDGGLSRGHGS